MKKIFQRIENHQKKFAQLPFFQFLERGDRLDDASIFVPGLAFFILTFQDVLRINEEKITLPEFQSIIRHHRQEDLGHDLWFLHDIRQLGLQCDASLLFGKRYSQTRNTSFEIISEIFRASDDHIRLVIPLALEAAGHVFFSRVHHFFAKTEYSGYLKYFSEEHYQIEIEHELFEQDINEILSALELSEELRIEAFEVVERIFTALTNMVCDLSTQIENHQIHNTISELQLA